MSGQSGNKKTLFNKAAFALGPNTQQISLDQNKRPLFFSSIVAHYHLAKSDNCLAWA